MAVKQAYSGVTGAGTDDIRPGEARNGVVHVLALTLTKTADALIRPQAGAVLASDGAVGARRDDRPAGVRRAQGGCDLRCGGRHRTCVRRAGGLGAAEAIFAAQIAYEGGQAGRKLHLTKMAEDTFRARYTALSNTLIGAALLAGGLFGIVADRFGPAPVLLTFAVIAALGAVLARGLDEVQKD